MLIGLNSSKFYLHNKQKDSYFSVSENKTKFAQTINTLRFPPHLDTQDFLIFNNYLFVLHHQACKNIDFQYTGNIEYFDLNNIDSTNSKKLFNNDELNYPTCLGSDNNHIAVGIGGKEFKSKIFVYDKLLSLRKVIDIDYGLKSPPSGMLFHENKLIVSFYKSNSIQIFDLNKNFKIASKINNLNFENPLSLAFFNKKIYASSHLGSKLIELNLQNEKINFINSELLQNPWGLFNMNNELIIINMNFDKRKSSSLVSLDLNNKLNPFQSKIDKEGLIVAKEININKFAY